MICQTWYARCWHARHGIQGVGLPDIKGMIGHATFELRGCCNLYSSVAAAVCLHAASHICSCIRSIAPVIQPLQAEVVEVLS